jgi:hypothetical protein
MDELKARILDINARPVFEIAVMGDLSLLGPRALQPKPAFKGQPDLPAMNDVALGYAADALRALAVDVVRGEGCDPRVAAKVGFVQIGDTAPIAVSAIFAWLSDRDGGPSEAAGIATILADGVEILARRRRRSFRVLKPA